LDISNFAGKDVIFRIQSRYDDNHDGGQGEGFYIDDFFRLNRHMLGLCSKWVGIAVVQGREDSRSRYWFLFFQDT